MRIKSTVEWLENRIGTWTIRYRWLIVVGTVIAAVVAGSGARFLTMNNDNRVFFGDRNPQLEALEALENTYTENQGVLFVVVPGDGNVFTREVLSAITELTEESWKMPYSSRVDSLVNFQHTRAEEDDLIVEDLVEDAAGLSDAELDRIRDIALSEPLLVNRLISGDGRVTAVNVNVVLPGESTAEVSEIAAFSRKLADDIRAGHPAVDIHLTGGVIMDNAFAEVGMADMGTLTPLMFLILIVVVGLILRSVRGTLATLSVILMSAIASMGLAGWLRISLTTASVGAPTIIMTLAVADSVHILTTMIKLMRRGHSKYKAISESLRVNLQPVFLTSATTAIGFLSMNFSDAPPFRDLGNIVAMGVAAAFVVSITFLPALLAILPAKAGSRSKRPQVPCCNSLANLVTRHGRIVLWSTIAIAIAITTGVARIELNDNWADYFSERFDIRRATDFAKDNLTGMDGIEYSLSAGEADGINDPEYLATVERFANWYRAQENVVHVNAITDIMKRLNSNMHGDDPAWHRLPDQRDLAAQYLLLYEMSLPFGLDLNNQINVDKSATRMIVTLSDVTTTQVRDLDARAREWLAANAPAAMHTYGSGLTVIWAHISQRNINGMLGATLGALVLISAILIVAFRSVKMGLLSLLPNLAPAFMAFGLWGFLFGQVGLGLSITISLTLGIVVDDTVHFLSKYLRARREHGSTATEAVRYAFDTVGTAMVVTTAALVAGFSVFLLSGFRMNWDMGLMTVMTITLALAMDVLLLPALLIAIDGRKTVAASQGEETRMTESAKSRRNVPVTVSTAMVVLLLLAPATWAQDAGQKGLAIARQVDSSDSGFGDSTAHLRMILRNRHGQESTREIRIRTLEVEDDGDKGLMIFDTPRDVKGTASLNFTHKTADDDQWLYLPALKRVKRISSRNKSGSFMGSEFAYEDVSSQEVEKYTYKWIRDDTLDGNDCFVVEYYPVDKKNSGYTRQVNWIDKQEYRPRRVDYYDRKDSLLKTLSFSGYRQYLDKYWRADEMSMVNHQNKKSTKLVFSDYRFRTGLKDSDFTHSSLKRVR